MTVLKRHPRLATLGLSLASLAVALGVVELTLRLADYRFSSIELVLAEDPDAHRPVHRGAADVREPWTLPDPDLLWRLNPAASAELTAAGFRGEPLPAHRRAGHVVIVTLGDSNTLGSLKTTDHWPGILQDLLRVNRSHSSFQVVNAGVYGHTSFQGLRRFRQVRPHAPDLVYFSFGVNDAKPARISDVRYAERMGGGRAWDCLRLGPPLVHRAWRAVDALGPDRPLTHRVPLDEYRRNLQAFVGEARAVGILPVLLTRPFLGASDDPSSWLHHAPAYNQVVGEVAASSGAPLFDAHALLSSEPRFFLDAMHTNRLGNRQLAEGLLAQLRDLGFVETADQRDLASALDLASADERRLELGPGFWMRETRADGPGGRWTEAEATLTLGRHRSERVLMVELTCWRPRGETRGRVEIDGRPVVDLPRLNGRHRLWVDLGPAVSPQVTVRFVVDSAYRLRDLEPGSGDSRMLGVFVHQARLLEEIGNDAVNLGALEDGHPSLVSGFWGRERWPDGDGRWTAGEAVWHMSAPDGAGTLWLDVRLQNPRGRTRGSVSLDGRTLGSFDEPNGRRLLPFACRLPAGRSARLRLRVDTAFQPTAYDPVSTDERTLGLVLHAAWLGGPVATQGPDPAVRLARTGNERWLQVDFTTAAPLTSGRFDVDGEMLYAFRRGPGRGHAVLDVSRFAGRVLTLRPVVDFPRGDHEAAGLVIHEVRLK